MLRNKGNLLPKSPPERGTTDWGDCVERPNAPKKIDLARKTPAKKFDPASKTPASAWKNQVGGAMTLWFVFSLPFFFCSFMQRNFIVSLYGPR